MNAYQAYYENGKIIPIGNPVIPEGRRIIITVLDEPIKETRSKRQIKALERFYEKTDKCNEPLDEEFDKIIGQRVSIDREIDL